MISRKVQELRVYVGLSQSQLAKLSGLTPAAISQIEGGLRKPSTTSLEKIAEALDVRVGYFFDGPKRAVPPKDLLTALETSTLTEHDKKEILKFADYLAWRRRSKKVKKEVL